ncbi:MAG TPA: hypothetical protein VG347_22505 [Verrucomicrobiae bacterium]|nr:hypothetical protein [Verrucomicrobiae bacterium]
MDDNDSTVTPKATKVGFSYAWWTPFGIFERIDNQQSETRRRITQNVIATVLAASILAVLGFIWSHWATLAGGSKTFLNFLESPIQLKLWILLLVIMVGYVAGWCIYRIRFKSGVNVKVQLAHGAMRILKKAISNSEIKTDCQITLKQRVQGKEQTSTVLTVFVKNNGQLANTLMQIGVNYQDGSSRGRYLGNSNRGITIGPNTTLTIGMDTLEPLLYDYEHGQKAKVLWVKDHLNIKHIITDSESKVTMYFVDETYG